MKHGEKVPFQEKPYISLLIILLIALIYRLIFYSGHIFNDDAYTARLAWLWLHEGGSEGFTGYPVVMIRTGLLFMTQMGYLLFGANEPATIFFPFLFSLLNIFITYKLAFFFTKSSHSALIAAFLLAFIPTEVFFASINFADMPSAVMVNASVLFLVSGRRKDKIWLSVLAGILLTLAFITKAALPYFTAILLAVYLLYAKLRKKKFDKHIAVTLAVFASGIVFEGVVYLIVQGNFFYRFEILRQNFAFAWYDFFPYNVAGKMVSGWERVYITLKTVFALNPRYLFLRRFYLFVPLAALIISGYLLYRKKQKLLVFWFLGLAFLLCFATLSPFEYRPVYLRFSWYVIGIFPPAVIVISLFLKTLNFRLLSAILIAYILGSYIMTNEYQKYQDVQNLQQLKQYLIRNPEVVINTDHHTGYSVGLIDGYPDDSRVKYLTGKKDLSEIKDGELVLYNKFIADEINRQGLVLPDFEILKSPWYKRKGVYGRYTVYEKQPAF